MAAKQKLPAQKGNTDILMSETPVSGYDADKLIGIARTQLLIRHPFLGRLTMRLVPTPTPMIPTAAVDPKGRMYYNEKFINACTIEDCMFVVAHEVMHLVLRCSNRFPEGGSHSIWNMASDIVVNIILDQAEISPRPEWRKEFLGFEGKYRTKYEKKLITDFIYYDLIKEIKDNSDCEACKQIAKGILDQNKQRSHKQRQEAEKENGSNPGGNNPSDGGDSGNEQGSMRVFFILKGGDSPMAYTPELSLRSSCTLRRISWALGVPMTKGTEFVFEFLPIILDREKVCGGCRDRTKCTECSFSKSPEQCSSSTQSSTFPASKGGETMTLPGECVRDVETSCVDCGAHLEIQVCKSMAGYYVGFWCDRCGPYSRESGYYQSREEAEKGLNKGTYARF